MKRESKSELAKTNWIILFVGLAFCSGCIPIDHYQVRSGKVALVHWDEGNGTQIDPVKEADAATFKQFPHCAYATDKNHVYFDGNIIPGANPATFARLADWYWSDQSRVYYSGKLVPGADPHSFRCIGYDYWWRDDRNVYVQGDPVNPRDLATFQLLNAHWAKDSKWYYPVDIDLYSPIEKLDYASFRILHGNWAKDRYRVFYASRVVEGADLKSFRPINELAGCDDTWFYIMGFRSQTIQQALKDGAINKVPPEPSN